MADDSTSAAPADQTPAQTGGGPPADWRSSLSEELRGEKSLESFKDVNGLAKSYIETKRMVGERPNGLTVPKDDAKPEEWAKFYGAIGRPETPDKYEIAKAEKLPEGLAWREEWEQKARTTAHNHGLSPKQFAAMVNLYNEIRLEEMDGAERMMAGERAKAEEALAKAWGPKDGPVFRRNVGLAREVIGKLFDGDPDLLAAAEGQGNNAAWVRGLAEKIAPLVLEDGLVQGEPMYGQSREELTRQINEVRQQLVGATGSKKTDLEARRDALYKARDGQQEFRGASLKG